MGPITRNDVESLLFDIESSLYEFNKTYLKNEYRDINRNTLQYFNKINNTYLTKLKRTIDMISLKFSTFLTDNNYKFFESLVYKQYNDIALYVNNNSDLIENRKNDVINLLNDSSTMLEKLFNLSYNNVYNTYEIFYSTIESKIEYLNENKRIRILDNNDKKKSKDDDVYEPEGPGDYKDKTYEQAVKNLFRKYFTYTQEEIKESLLEKINNFLEENDLEVAGAMTMNSEFFKHIKGLNLGVSLCKIFDPDIDLKSYKYSFFSCSFIELAFVIKPIFEAGICLELGFDLNWDKKEYSFYIDVYGKAEASVALEVGAYVPSAYSPIQVSLSLGIKGVLGSGKAGIKLSLFMGINRYDTKVYFEANALMLSFYILFKFSADLKIYKFSFEFYIINKLLFGLRFETFSTVTRFYNSTRKETVEGYALSCLLIKDWKKYKGTNCARNIK